MLVFAIDLANAEVGESLSVAGVVNQRKRVNGGYALQIKDATGMTWVHTTKIDETVRKRARLLATGTTEKNERNGRIILRCTEKPQVLGNFESLAGVDDAFREQTIRLLSSRVIEYTTAAFKAENFVQIDTRLLSTSSPVVGLEPIQARFPGFGTPVSMSTSPANQLRNFMMVTGVKRVFTVSSSFSTSFRFAGSGTEMKVVMGLAIGLDDESHEQIIGRVLSQVLSRIGHSEQSLTPGVNMPEGIRIVDEDTAQVVKSDSWQTMLKRWIKVIALPGDIIMEGSLEQLSNQSHIASITLYPEHVLSLLRTVPTRRLEDLRRIHWWIDE